MQCAPLENEPTWLFGEMGDTSGFRGPVLSSLFFFYACNEELSCGNKKIIFSLSTSSQIVLRCGRRGAPGDRLQ